MRSLLELGHRHLLTQIRADCRTPLPWRLRLAGYRQAFEEFGLDPKSHLHVLSPPVEWRNPVYLPESLGKGLSRTAALASPLVRCLEAHPEITAILAQNDPAALQVWHVLHAAELRIPRDLSLVGFDDVRTALGAGRQNLLSSVRVPLEDMGREAARLVLRMVDGEAGPDTRVVLPTTFVPRKSVGPPREGPLPLR